MKKQLFKHLVLCTALVLGLIFSFGKTAYADFDTKGVVYATLCCRDGAQTGISNDCISGSGSCIDHFCLPTETETSLNCLNP